MAAWGGARHEFSPAWGSLRWWVRSGGNGGWIHRGDGERVNLPAIHKKKLKHKITLNSFMHLLIQTHQPFELTSSPVTVGGVCIYV